MLCSNHWSFICTLHYQRELGHSLHLILNLLTWKDCTARLWLNGIYIQPVTCGKGPKVPFAVTCHIWNNTPISCMTHYTVYVEIFARFLFSWISRIELRENKNEIYRLHSSMKSLYHGRHENVTLPVCMQNCWIWKIFQWRSRHGQDNISQQMFLKPAML